MYRQAIEHMDNAGVLAAMLVGHGVFFSVTPLPDDVWEFAVQSNTQHVLKASINLITEQEEPEK